VSDPNDSDALMFAAHESVKNGSINNASLQFRQVIHLEPNQDRAYIGLANAYLCQGDTQMAIQVLFDCIKENGSPRSRLALARIFEIENRYDRAIEQFIFLHKQNPHDIKILTHLASLYVKEHNVNKAEQYLKEYALLVSDPIPSRLVLADFYRSTGQFSAAHETVDTILLQKKSTLQAYEEKIRILHAENKNQHGFDFIKTDVKNATLKDYLRAELYTLQGNYKKAESYYWKSLANGDRNGQVYYKLANIYLQQKKYSRGIDVCKKISLVSPLDVKAHFLAGYLYQLDKQYASAIAEYKTALEKSPIFFPAVNNLAFLYAEKFPSKSNLEDALEMMITHDFLMTIEGLDTLAWIYTKKGDYEYAISLLEKLSSRSDSTPVIYYHLGVTYMKKGAILPAKLWIEKSLASEQDFIEKPEAQALLESLQTMRESTETMPRQ
ncbi:MAG: tetratricopeptide repeat protein, partial [Desulfoplanes sp.]